MKKLTVLILLPISIFCQVTDIDNNTYQTTVINGTEWMAENLRVSRFNNGDIIPNIVNDSVWANTNDPAWCWFNNDSINYAFAGKLYNYYTVSDQRNVCPQGWSVPSYNDFFELVNFLDSLHPNNVGIVLKDSVGWPNPAHNGSNIYGFNGTPNGYRWDLGYFGNDSMMSFCTTTQDTSSLPNYYYFSVRGDTNYILPDGLYSTHPNFGDAIRCKRTVSLSNDLDLENSSISVYPNPTKENINISIDNFNGNIQTEVFDFIGNRLQLTNETTISLRNYSKGIYILKVAYGDRVEEIKVIKD